MFVQIIEGRTSDPDGMDRQVERWQTEVRAGADGFLGVTAGVTADGRSIAIVRFESEAAARANSERPEQTAWWAEMEKFFDGDATFTESTDVEEFLGGGTDDAGFVQIMKSTGVDRARMARLDEQFARFAELRPDLLGTFRVWTGPDRCIEANYFVSEADARAGEAKELPDEVQAMAAEFGDLMRNTEFLDLTDPQLR
jgi:hypothetical protein